MKKLIIAACAIALAMVSQAAAVSWSATSIKDIDGNTAKNKSGWQIVCTIYDSTGANVIASDTATTTSSIGKASGTIDGTATGTSYMAQLVATDDKGNTISSEKASFTTDGAAEYGPINFSTGAGFATSGAKINYASGWVAAPEPTSGLLLLLGVAGLALKRKRA